MRNYKNEVVTVPHLESVTCNICGMNTNDPKAKDDNEVEYFTSINIPFGYWSIFGDVDIEVKLDICQHCLKKMIPEKVIDKEIQNVIENE